MKRFLLKSVSLFIPLTVASAVFAQDKDITVTLTNMTDSGTLEEPLCEYSYSIENNSHGTLKFIGLGAAFEGKARGFMYFTSIIREKEFTVAVGETLELTSQVAFVSGERKCSSINAIRINKISEANCNIRMLPEEVKCSDIVSVSSAVSGVVISKTPSP